VTFIVYRLLFTCFRRFLPLQIETGSSFGCRWCHKQILMSPIDSATLFFYRWSVDVFRLSGTVKKLFEIFGCALKCGCKFAFETNFCKFDPYNYPIPYTLPLHIVYLAEMRILSYQASCGLERSGLAVRLPNKTPKKIRQSTISPHWEPRYPGRSL
jgi:hypothetical protein